MNRKSSGYVLIFVLFIISLCVVLLATIVRSSLVFQRQAYFGLDNEKAKLLALSGIQLALDQISIVVPPEKKEDKSKIDKEKEQDKEKKAEESLETRWFSKLINTVDIIKTFKLTQQDFGLDGEISLYISCEQGKINLRQLIAALKFENKIEDKNKDDKDDKDKEKTEKEIQKEKEPKKTYLGIIDDLIQKQAKFSVVNGLKELTKKIGRDIEDPTELLLLPEFRIIKDNIFISLEPSKNKSGIYLMDLFAVAPGSGRINPWFLSNSFKKVLGFTDKKNTQELRKHFKPNMDWSKDWDKIFAPIYGKNYASINEEIKKMIAPSFEAAAFSVLVVARVGNAVQRIYSICERDRNLSGTSPNSIIFKIAKIYWL